MLLRGIRIEMASTWALQGNEYDENTHFASANGT